MSVPDRPRILVVDDEPDFLTSLTDILQSRGYECLTAGTVHEAADLAARQLPNLCLVDLKLPDGSGLDLIPKIRVSSPATESVILTGYASLPTAVKAMSLGAFGYLEKPYNVDRLFLTLEKALERQRLVQTVQRSETAYSQLLNATGAAIFSIAPITWRLSNVNPAFSKLLGYTSEEADYLSLDQLLPDSERLPMMKMLTELSKSRPEQTRNLTFEAPLRRKDGTPGWFSINAMRIARHETADRRPPTADRPDSGAVSGERLTVNVPLPKFDLLLVCSDISVSRKALTELEQTKNFIEGVFAALPCGVVIVNSDYRIIDANPAYFKPLGLDRSEVRSRHCHGAFNCYTNPCSMFGELCPITAARTTGTIGRVYREHRLPDGRVRNLEYTANPLLDEHGSITAFVVVVNDLTNLREAEERLQQAKIALEDLNTALRRHHEELEENAGRLEQTNVELVKLSNAKSDFVATVSHELRTPLTAIAEGIALVEDGSLGELNSDQHTFLRLASHNTKRLADLINDLLDLSKIEAGKMELTPRRLDLSRLVRDVVSTYSNGAQGNGLSLKAEIAPTLDPVLADEPSVQRVLTNLIGNAIKFTPAGGTITVTASRVPPTADRQPLAASRQPQAASEERQAEGGKRLAESGARIAVSVVDTGIGIPKDQQHRLFGKFEQISQPGEMRPRGTGLGLVLTRQLVEMNQGRIWVESDEGKGSRFCFTLPIYDEQTAFVADFQRFAAAAANGKRGAPAIYLFQAANRRPQATSRKPQAASGERQADSGERIADSGARIAAGVPTQACVGILPQLSELLESLFPKPYSLSVVGAACAVVVFTPRKPPEERLQAAIESLKGASFFVGEQEVSVRLSCAAVDYDPAFLLERRPEEIDFAVLYDLMKPRLKEVR